MQGRLQLVCRAGVGTGDVGTGRVAAWLAQPCLHDIRDPRDTSNPPCSFTSSLGPAHIKHADGTNGQMSYLCLISTHRSSDQETFSAGWYQKQHMSTCPYWIDVTIRKVDSLWVESVRQGFELAGALCNAASAAKLTVAVIPGSATCCALACIAAGAC